MRYLKPSKQDCLHVWVGLVDNAEYKEDTCNKMIAYTEEGDIDTTETLKRYYATFYTA